MENIAKYKLPIILGSASIFAICLSIILLVKSVQTTTPIQFSSNETASVFSEIRVDVEGAVVKPGLYRLPDDARVEDAIAAASGLSGDVDAETFGKTINRAMKLVDGAKIYIPTQDSEVTSGLISVNTASLSELESLPGVGEVTAKKITDNRPYQTFEELISKKAVGTALFEKIKSQISL